MPQDQVKASDYYSVRSAITIIIVIIVLRPAEHDQPVNLAIIVAAQANRGGTKLAWQCQDQLSVRLGIALAMDK